MITAKQREARLQFAAVANQFAHAARELTHMWEVVETGTVPCNPSDVPDYPSFLPSFDEATLHFAQWNDKVQEWANAEEGPDTPWHYFQDGFYRLCGGCLQYCWADGPSGHPVEESACDFDFENVEEEAAKKGRVIEQLLPLLYKPSTTETIICACGQPQTGKETICRFCCEPLFPPLVQELIESLEALRTGYQIHFDAMPVAWQTYDAIAEAAIKKARGGK